jgi:hypothetical protein
VNPQAVRPRRGAAGSEPLVRQAVPVQLHEASSRLVIDERGNGAPVAVHDRHGDLLALAELEPQARRPVRPDDA